MTTQIKITQLTDIGSANLAVNTLLPVVNMSGTPTTQKTTLGNLANVILSQSGSNYARVASANIAYSVANAAQPNITSVGTLTSLSVTGNVTSGNVTTAGLITVTGNIGGGNITTAGKVGAGTLSVTGTTNLGAVGNVTITGGTNGQVLTTNGSNVLSWTTVSGGGTTPGGVNTQIQFNDSGTFNGNTGFTFNKTTGLFTAPFLAGNGNGLSNIQGANVSGTVGNANLSQNLNVSDVNNNFSYHVVLSAGSGDKSLHIDADDNLQYNPADGTLTAIRVDAGFMLGNLIYSTGYLASNVVGLGNIATLNLTGSTSNVLYGNGVFAPVTTTYGNSNVVSLLSAFGSNTITTTGNITLGNAIFSDGSTLSGSVLATEVSANIFAGTSLPGLETDYTDSVVMLDDAFTQNSGEAGYPWGITLPVSYLTYDELIQLSPGTFPNQTAVTTIANNVQNNYELWQDTIAETNVTLTANEINWVFDSSGNLTLPGNTFAVNYANGQQVQIGGGSGNTGNVTFDDVTVQGDNNSLNLSAGADFTANLAYLQVRAGDVSTHIHLDTGNNEAYDQYFGNDNKFVKLGLGIAGNVSIGTYQDGGIGQFEWTFDSNGNLILAGGNSVIQSIANSSLDPLNPNVSTMVLTPSDGYTSQALVLDPTAPGHIHLRAPSSNIDEPLANIFLGGEESSFEVGYYNGSAPNVFIHSGGNTWTFDTIGSLNLPTIELDVGNTINEQTIIQSQRKIIPPFRYSVDIEGSTPTVVYSATDNSITSMKVTMQIQHTGLGFEFFDVSATSSGADTYYTVSNRLHPPGITDSTVVVDLDDSNAMEITVTINSGAANSWVTYDATEFGIAVD